MGIQRSMKFQVQQSLLRLISSFCNHHMSRVKSKLLSVSEPASRPAPSESHSSRQCLSKNPLLRPPPHLLPDCLPSPQQAPRLQRIPHLALSPPHPLRIPTPADRRQTVILPTRHKFRHARSIPARQHVQLGRQILTVGVERQVVGVAAKGVLERVANRGQSEDDVGGDDGAG